MSELTKQQRAVLDAIAHAVETKGYPPSVRELAKAIGVRSVSTVHAHLVSLERSGHIERSRGQSRSITIQSRKPILEWWEHAEAYDCYCAGRSKPCPYHEGWQDALDQSAS